MNSELIIIRGGGDLATGVVQKFFRSGFRVLILETQAPTAIRRSVSLCEAVYNGTAVVEGMTSQLVATTAKADDCWKQGRIPVMVDPWGESIAQLKPEAVVDAIIAKRNLGMKKSLAPITIALGPGFTAGVDADVVIETMRGHDLGRLILTGTALPNTGTPGEIGGKGAMRVIHAPIAGRVSHRSTIGDVVTEGAVIFVIDGTPVYAPFTGLLRGLIRDGLDVSSGMKVGDIDPRTDVDWRTISDKARCLGGAALEAYFYLKQKREDNNDR